MISLVSSRLANSTGLDWLLEVKADAAISFGIRFEIILGILCFVLCKGVVAGDDGGSQAGPLSLGTVIIAITERKKIFPFATC